MNSSPSSQLTNNLINLPDIFSNFLGGVLQWAVVGILGLVYLQSKKKLIPLFYKYLGARVAYFIQTIINYIIDPKLRLAIISILLVIVNAKGGGILTSIGIFLLSLSMLWKPSIKVSFDPLPRFSDDFSSKKHTEKSWIAKTHKLKIEKDFGKPAPDLGLRYIGTEATNTFLYLKDIEAEEGVIECDVYLEKGAVFNLVFLADIKQHNWYMARLDARQGASDGLLIKDEGPGNNWRPLTMSGTISRERDWMRIRVEFNQQKASFYKNNELLIEKENLIEKEKLGSFGKKIGLFNELVDVHVDNFAIT